MKGCESSTEDKALGFCFGHALFLFQGSLFTAHTLLIEIWKEDSQA